MSTPQQGPQYQPQQPYGQQPGQGQQPMMGPPAPPSPAGPAAKPKRFGWLALGVAAIVALLLGIGIGGAGGKSTTATAKPAPTVTVTSTVPAANSDSSDEPSDDPTDDSSTYEPKKSDFEIDVKTLQKECFGSAGCNVTFRIKPSYVGSQDLPTSGEIEVSYRITGLEDPVENTFTIDSDGTAHFDKEEYGSTESKSDKLGAKITDVSYSG